MHSFLAIKIVLFLNITRESRNRQDERSIHSNLSSPNCRTTQCIEELSIRIPPSQVIVKNIFLG